MEHRSSPLTISPEAFLKAFPFHFVCEPSGRILQSGEAFRRLVGGAPDGGLAEDVFALEKPEHRQLGEMVNACSGELVMLRHLPSAALLRGGFSPGADPETSVFVGGLWVTDPITVDALGLSINDFAPHDAVIDLAHLVQSFRSTTDDLKQVMSRLNAQRRELVDTNQRLSESEKKARLLGMVAEKTDNAVVITDRFGVIEWVNEGFERISGYPLSEARGKKPGELLQGPGTDEETVRFMADRLSAGEPFNTLIQNYHRDGTPYWLELEVQPIHGSSGEIQHFVAVQRDVTDDRMAQDAIARRDAILSSIATLSREFFIVPDWHEAIDRNIENVGQASDSEGVFVVEITQRIDGDVIGTRVAEWMRGQSFLERYPERALNWTECGIADWHDRLAFSEPIVMSLASATENERTTLKMLRHAAIAMMPVFAEDRLWGAIGFIQIENAREWTDPELDALETVARVLGAAVERARQAKALRDAFVKLDSALEGGELSLCVIHAHENRIEFDARLGAALGYHLEPSVPLTDFEAWIHPQDLQEFQQSVVTLVTGRVPRMDATVRMRTEGAVYRWFRFRVAGSAESDSLFGTVQDVHEKFRADALQAETLEELREARVRYVTAAAAVQRELLTKRPAPRNGRFAVAGNSLPSSKVGGDFFDVFTITDGVVDIVLGDVMGKGLTAALVAAGLKSQIARTLGLTATSGKAPSPRHLVQAIHDLFIEQFQTLECYATMAYARIDASRMSMELVDCGHTRTIIWSRETGACRFVSGNSLPLGVLRGLTFEPEMVKLEPGDLVLLYSDGVTDTKVDGEAIGEEGLARLVSEAASAVPYEPVEAVESTLLALSVHSERIDDFTYLCILLPENMAEDSVLRTQLSSELANIDRVRECVSDGFQVSQHQWPDADKWMVELAAVEVFTNIVRHAHALRPGERVTVETEDRMSGLEVRFRYSGEPFTPPNRGAEQEPRMAEGGYGLTVIERTVDAVEYQQDDRGRMWVTLRKNAPKKDS